MGKILAACALLLFTLGTTVSAQETRQLSMKGAVLLAIEKNLDVRAELYNPAAAEADVQKYQGIYNPLLSLLLQYQDSRNRLSTAGTTGTVALTRQRSEIFNAGISKLFSTGGTVGLSFNNSWNHNNFSNVLNDYFQSDLTLSVSQPLLRNFGKETTNLNIDVARLNKEGSLEQFRARLLDTVAQAKIQYNNLVSSRQNLESKRAALRLAETILSNTQAQVNAGVLPAMEILNSRFGVATRQKEVIDAERAVRDQVDILKNLLQLPVADIIPTDVPSRDEIVVDEGRETTLALAERPDVRQLRVQVKTGELQARVAKNQTLPQLDLTASSSLTGLAEDYGGDLERIGSAKDPAWAVGLQFSYPLGNDAAENEYVRTKLRVEQARTQVQSLESAIARDVGTAVRGVRSGFRQIEVTARGREYADAVVQAYVKRQQVGMATTKDLLDVLNNQVAAQSLEIQAVAEYNNAVVNLWRTTGELLAREGITLRGNEADELYRKNK